MLSGCAATSPTISETTSVTATDPFTKAFDGAATVLVLRDGAFQGSLLPLYVLVDDQRAASLDVNQRVTIFVPAGERNIVIEPALPPQLSGRPASIIQLFTAGRTYYFVTSFTGSGAVVMPVTAASVAAR